MNEKINVLLHMMRAARSREDRRDARMRKNELERRRFDRNRELPADGFDRGDPLHDMLRCWAIVVMCVWDSTGGQDATVVATAEGDRDVAPFAERKKRVERILLEKGIAPGQKETVEIPLLKRLLASRPFIAAYANGFHQAIRPQAIKRLISPIHRLPKIHLLLLGSVGEDVDIMNKGDINGFQRKALQAVFE